MYRTVAERVAVRHERSGKVTTRDQDSWRGKDQICDLLKEDVWRGKRNKNRKHVMSYSRQLVLDLAEWEWGRRSCKRG